MLKLPFLASREPCQTSHRCQYTVVAYDVSSKRYIFYASFILVRSFCIVSSAIWSCPCVPPTNFSSSRPFSVQSSHEFMERRNDRSIPFESPLDIWNFRVVLFRRKKNTEIQSAKIVRINLLFALVRFFFGR